MDIAPEKLEAFERRLAAEREKRRVENALAHYVPYEKQRAFHGAGATHRERLLIAANQSGKTLAGGMECAMHATGRYPSWWTGKRFDKPTIGWCAGTTNENDARHRAAYPGWQTRTPRHQCHSQGRAD